MNRGPLALDIVPAQAFTFGHKDYRLYCPGHWSSLTVIITRSMSLLAWRLLLNLLLTLGWWHGQQACWPGGPRPKRPCLFSTSKAEALAPLAKGQSNGGLGAEPPVNRPEGPDCPASFKLAQIIIKLVPKIQAHLKTTSNSPLGENV